MRKIISRILIGKMKEKYFESKSVINILFPFIFSYITIKYTVTSFNEKYNKKKKFNRIKNII